MAQPANQGSRGSAPGPGGGGTLAPRDARPPGARSPAPASRKQGTETQAAWKEGGGGSSASPCPYLPTPSPPAASLGDQRPRTPGRLPSHCRHLPAPVSPAPAGPLRPSPYLSRRCAPGGGGPCWSRTTGRSGSGHGDSGPRAACVGAAAARTPRTRRLWPPPARPAPPGAPRGSGPSRPSAPPAAGPERGVGLAPRAVPRAVPPAAPSRAPRAERGAGRLDAGRRGAGRQGGRRKRREKFAQEGAAYSLLSLPPAQAAGLGAGRPRGPRTCPAAPPPGAGLCPLRGGGGRVPLAATPPAGQWDLGVRSWDARSRLT